ncbi:metal ABC transporter solute-binding protein, Zn/Mn family [Zavarzinella formosa]|uniref:metal ABC transporter solute-binding protein, Zn/Mn family n=1 Tax=Zavarzinella formosa TaxID=360055 RepID=UPI0002ECBDBC|nr:zinc ABC transporter substrate-binding protein [Zavarzinella formosa]
MISYAYDLAGHMNRSRFLLPIFFCGVILFGGCKKASGPLPTPDLSGRKLRVLATTGMIADAAKAIAGDNAEVEALFDPGVDPHRYVPTPGDLTKLNKADLVLYNGLHLEGKMADIFSSRSKTKWTVGVADHLTGLRSAEGGIEGNHDPHVWFDVQKWKQVTEKIRDSLREIDPAHAEQYSANAAEYLKRLDTLDDTVRTNIKLIPAEKRVLITAHDAFGYFGQAYGIEVKGLQGVSTATDTSSRDVSELAELIGTRKIRAIFPESSVPDKGMQSVIQAVRQKYAGFEVTLAAEPLYSDALGLPGSDADTYEKMVRHNVRVIVKSLTGESPPDLK